MLADQSSFSAEYGLAAVFALARQTAPCLVIFEDLDSMITPQARSFFLNEVDGLSSNDGIMIIGTTNHIELLDPGISRRPSRFDRKYNFTDPDFEQRAQYAKYWQGKLKDNNDISFPNELCDAIAKITDGFSFAYIQEAFVATLLAIAHQQDVSEVAGNGDFVVAQPKFQKFQKLQTYEDDLDQYVLWREIKKQVKLLRDELGAEPDHWHYSEAQTFSNCPAFAGSTVPPAPIYQKSALRPSPQGINVDMDYVQFSGGVLRKPLLPFTPVPPPQAPQAQAATGATVDLPMAQSPHLPQRILPSLPMSAPQAPQTTTTPCAAPPSSAAPASGSVAIEGAQLPPIFPPAATTLSAATVPRPASTSAPPNSLAPAAKLAKPYAPPAPQAPPKDQDPVLWSSAVPRLPIPVPNLTVPVTGSPCPPAAESVSSSVSIPASFVPAGTFGRPHNPPVSQAPPKAQNPILWGSSKDQGPLFGGSSQFSGLFTSRSPVPPAPGPPQGSAAAPAPLASAAMLGKPDAPPAPQAPPKDQNPPPWKWGEPLHWKDQNPPLRKWGQPLPQSSSPTQPAVKDYRIFTTAQSSLASAATLPSQHNPQALLGAPRDQNSLFSRSSMSVSPALPVVEPPLSCKAVPASSIQPGPPARDGLPAGWSSVACQTPQTKPAIDEAALQERWRHGPASYHV